MPPGENSTHPTWSKPGWKTKVKTLPKLLNTSWSSIRYCCISRSCSFVHHVCKNDVSMVQTNGGIDEQVQCAPPSPQKKLPTYYWLTVTRTHTNQQTKKPRNQTNKQTNKGTNKTNKHTSKQASKQTSKETNKQTKNNRGCIWSTSVCVFLLYIPSQASYWVLNRELILALRTIMRRFKFGQRKLGQAWKSDHWKGTHDVDEGANSGEHSSSSPTKLGKFHHKTSWAPYHLVRKLLLAPSTSWAAQNRKHAYRAFGQI